MSYKTFYYQSFHQLSSVFTLINKPAFLYEKDHEQSIKTSIPLEDSPIKNRFEIRLKNERASMAVYDLLEKQDVEHTAFAIINRYLRFVDEEKEKCVNSGK